MPATRIIDPTIELQWSWIRGYNPWIEELKLAFDDFGRDTGLVDRLGEPVRVGDLLSGSQEKPCPCATRTDPGTPQEFARDHGYPPPPWAPRPASILTPPPPRKDPWNIPPNPPPQLPKRTTRTYFVYWSPEKESYIGRTFFQCEQGPHPVFEAGRRVLRGYAPCSPEEEKERVLMTFDNVVYIGNIYDYPELFRLNPARDFAAGTPYATILLARAEHFK